MTITQHAHIYSFHTSNFIFGQIIFLKFYQFHPYCQIAASVVGEHQELVVHGRVVTLIHQQWGQAGGTILISLFNWPWLPAGPLDAARFLYCSIF